METYSTSKEYPEETDMEKYKISNTLEVLFNIKEADFLQITSFNRAQDWKEGNEEYILTILVTRDTEKTEDKPAEKAARDRPAGIIIP